VRFVRSTRQNHRSKPSYGGFAVDDKRGDRVRRSTALLAALAVAAIIVSSTAARSSAAASAPQGDQSDAAVAVNAVAYGTSGA